MEVLSRRLMITVSFVVLAFVVGVGGLIVSPLSPRLWDEPEALTYGESVGFLIFWAGVGLTSIPWRARRQRRNFTFTFAEEGVGYFISQVGLACLFGPFVWLGILRGVMDDR